MDIVLPGLRDRRVAAADENMTRDSRNIYGRQTGARILSDQSRLRGGRFDVRRAALPPRIRLINTIVLHQTTFFCADALPTDNFDSRIESSHRLDAVIAHFIVRTNGVVIYTHDVEHVLNSVSGRHGVHIEFEDAYGHDQQPQGARLSVEAILAGRRLIAALIGALPCLQYIHPHGQIQQDSTAKLHSCCGPDIWVNVGAWAANHMSLICDNTSVERPNHGISPRQSNPAYDRQVESYELTFDYLLDQLITYET